jgi:kynurenine formamidase
MKSYDLTHIITEDMPVYPGTKPPKLTPVNTLEADGFAETLLTLYSHTGTHMDAPAHMALDGMTLDQMDVDRFIGPAVCIDVRNAGQFITLEDLMPHQEAIGDSDFVLLCTGWSQKWGQPDYSKGFPVLEEAAANYLAANNLKGIGIDCISVDPTETHEFPNHGIIFGACLFIIENLKNLEAIVGKQVVLACLPMNFYHSDGAPVRAIALEGCLTEVVK